jgi:hypothetical protein
LIAPKQSWTFHITHIHEAQCQNSKCFNFKEMASSASAIITLASLTVQLKSQQASQLETLKAAEESGVSELIVEARHALQETRNLLTRIGDTASCHNISSSIPFPLLEANDALEPSIREKLTRDVQNLSLQLRCNLVTEDRPHMGRIYLQSFVGEDAISWLERRAETDRLELLGKAGHDRPIDESMDSPLNTPDSSPSSSRSASPSPSRSPRSSRGGRRRRGAVGIGRMEALWVANELVRSGEWQQLTVSPDKRVEKAAKDVGCTSGNDPHQTSSSNMSAMLMSPTGRVFHPHSSLLQFTLFRMRTWPALNEQHKWECSAARDAEGVACHLLALVAELGLEELGEGLLRSRSFERFERATAELQRVEYVGLGPAGLTSFLVNLHNIMVWASHFLHPSTSPSRSAVSPLPPRARLPCRRPARRLP